MEEKRHNYKLTDSFVEQCVKALALNDAVDEIFSEAGETEEQTKARLNEFVSKRKTEYRLFFIQNS